MITPYGDRPETSLPMTRLTGAKTTFSWSKNLEEQNAIKLLEAEANLPQENAGIFKEERWSSFTKLYRTSAKNFPNRSSNFIF